MTTARHRYPWLLLAVIGVFGVLATIAIQTWYANWRFPDISMREGFRNRVLTPQEARLPTLVPGYAIALLAALAIGQWSVRQFLFHPTRAKLLGMAALWLLASFPGWGLLPFANAMVLMSISTEIAIGSDRAILYVGAEIGALILSYLVSCILVAGIGPRVFRFLGFLLVWWAVYVTSILLFGIPPSTV